MMCASALLVFGFFLDHLNNLLKHIVRFNILIIIVIDLDIR